MSAVSTEVVLHWQQRQYKHDKSNHFDIVALHKIDRLKHYALHFAKYAGRLAAGENGSGKRLHETAVDSLLVSLSSANALPQRLVGVDQNKIADLTSVVGSYVMAMGSYCDCVEKIDHAEFDGIRSRLLEANQTLFEIAVNTLWFCEKDPETAISARRAVLTERAFYAKEIQ